MGKKANDTVNNKNARIYFENLEKKFSKVHSFLTSEELTDWSYDKELERQIAVDILQRLDAIFLDQLFDEKNNKWFECEDMITQLLKERYNNGK